MHDVQWPALRREAMADGDFLFRARDTHNLTEADLNGCFNIAQTGPLIDAESKSFAVGGKQAAAKMEQFVKLLDAAYSANVLYTGISATKTEGGELGGREVMVQPNTTETFLTPTNYRVVSLGQATRADFDARFPVSANRAKP